VPDTLEDAAAVLEHRFKQARRAWAARVAEPLSEPPQPSAVELAIELLVAIAEDPMIRGSHRAAARRHLRKLQKLSAPG
jgi:hypothetical protein